MSLPYHLIGNTSLLPIDGFHSIFTIETVRRKGHVMWILTNQQAAW